jgi:hypothetical protein
MGASEPGQAVKGFDGATAQAIHSPRALSSMLRLAALGLLVLLLPLAPQTASAETATATTRLVLEDAAGDTT